MEACCEGDSKSSTKLTSFDRSRYNQLSKTIGAPRKATVFDELSSVNDSPISSISATVSAAYSELTKLKTHHAQTKKTGRGREMANLLGSLDKQVNNCRVKIGKGINELGKVLHPDLVSYVHQRCPWYKPESSSVDGAKLPSIPEDESSPETLNFVFAEMKSHEDWSVLQLFWRILKLCGQLRSLTDHHATLEGVIDNSQTFSFHENCQGKQSKLNGETELLRLTDLQHFLDLTKLNIDNIEHDISKIVSALDQKLSPDLFAHFCHVFNRPIPQTRKRETVYEEIRESDEDAEELKGAFRAIKALTTIRNSKLLKRRFSSSDEYLYPRPSIEESGDTAQSAGQDVQQLKQIICENKRKLRMYQKILNDNLWFRDLKIVPPISQMYINKDPKSKLTKKELYEQTQKAKVWMQIRIFCLQQQVHKVVDSINADLNKLGDLMRPDLFSHYYIDNFLPFVCENQETSKTKPRKSVKENCSIAHGLAGLKMLLLQPKPKNHTSTFNPLCPNNDELIDDPVLQKAFRLRVLFEWREKSKDNPAAKAKWMERERQKVEAEITAVLAELEEKLPPEMIARFCWLFDSPRMQDWEVLSALKESSDEYSGDEEEEPVTTLLSRCENKMAQAKSTGIQNQTKKLGSKSPANQLPPKPASEHVDSPTNSKIKVKAEVDIVETLFGQKQGQVKKSNPLFACTKNQNRSELSGKNTPFNCGSNSPWKLNNKPVCSKSSLQLAAKPPACESALKPATIPPLFGPKSSLQPAAKPSACKLPLKPATIPPLFGSKSSLQLNTNSSGSTASLQLDTKPSASVKPDIKPSVCKSALQLDAKPSALMNPDTKPSGCKSALQLDTKSAGSESSLPLDVKSSGSKSSLKPDAKPFGSKSLLQPDAKPFNCKSSLQPDAKPFGSKSPLQPYAKPFGSKSPLQPDAKPFGSKSPLQPDAKPFGSKSSLHPDAKPFGSKSSLQPDAKPFGYKSSLQPDALPFNSKSSLQPDAIPFGSKSFLQPDAKPFISKSSLQPNAEPFVPYPCLYP